MTVFEKSTSVSCILEESVRKDRQWWQNRREWLARQNQIKILLFESVVLENNLLELSFPAQWGSDFISVLTWNRLHDQCFIVASLKFITKNISSSFSLVFRFLLETQIRIALFIMISTHQSRLSTFVLYRSTITCTYQWEWSCMAVCKVTQNAFHRKNLYTMFCNLSVL